MTTDWKSLSIHEIEQRYDQAVYAPNARAVNQWYTEESRRVRSQVACERFQYGQGSSEYGYWFRAPQAGRPIVVFVHGGAWRMGTAEDYLFPAQWLVGDAGLNYVCLNFDNTPATGGRLFPMVNQLVQGLLWVVRRAKEFDASTQVHLVSHSSGSHLTACLAGLDWGALLPDAPGSIRSVLLCSGIYDLEPVVHSKRREYLELAPAEVFALSPVKHAVWLGARMGVFRGELESPEFIRQHDAYVAKLQRLGVSTQTGVGPELNHFEIMQTFGQVDGYMARRFQTLLEAV